MAWRKEDKKEPALHTSEASASLYISHHFCSFGTWIQAFLFTASQKEPCLPGIPATFYRLAVTGTFLDPGPNTQQKENGLFIIAAAILL